MTFYIQEKETDKPIFEFKIHSFDIYTRYLDDEFKLTEETRDEMTETNIINENTGEVILIMKNATIWYIAEEYYLVLEDA